MFYTIVNKLTGEIDENCGKCSIGIVGTHEDLECRNVGEYHMILEISQEEYMALTQSVKFRVIDKGEQIILDDYPNGVSSDPVYTKKVDAEKSRLKIDDRLKVNVPIEIDGIGGKEIIGYELKPENIVTEKARAK